MKTIKYAKEFIDREMYDYYRQNRRKVAKGIDQYMLWRKAIAGMIIVINDLIEDNENGLYIEGFGYFCAKKRALRKKRISIVKKIEETTYYLSLEFENNDLNRRYKFRRHGNIFFKKIDYQPKFEAVKYEVDIKKKFKIKD